MNKNVILVFFVINFVCFFLMDTYVYSFEYQNYYLQYETTHYNEITDQNDNVSNNLNSTITINVEPGFGYKYITLLYDKDTISKARSHIDIDVKPLFLAFLRYDILWGNFSINGEVQNSFGIGGSSTSNDVLNNSSGLNSKYSYLFLFAVSYLGFESMFTYDIYTLGTAKYSIDLSNINQNKKFSGDFPFITKKQQLDLIYHFKDAQLSPAIRKDPLLKNYNFFIGLRYLNYFIPAVIYVPNNEDDKKEKPFLAESFPYLVKYKTYSAGIGFEKKQTDFSDGIHVLYAFSLYLGFGRNNQTYMWVYREYNSKISQPWLSIISPCAMVSIVYAFNKPVLSQLKFTVDVQSYSYSISSSATTDANDGTPFHVYYSWWLSFVSQF